MKKFLSITLSILFAAQINLVPTYADDNSIQYAPVNPEYESYLNESQISSSSVASDSDDYNGIIPNEYIIPYTDSDDGIAEASESLPSSYNTEEIKSYISPVKDQRSLGTCWDFAATASLESNLLKKGNFSNNDTYDFSENHARYATSNANNNDYGFSRLPDAGGNFGYMRSYWTRGKVNGPVDEDDDPYDNLSYSSGGTRTVDVTESFAKSNVYVKDTIELPNLPSSPTETQLANRINEIKELVYDNGAAYFHVKIDSNNMNYNTMAYYNSSYETINHAVCIVGWDDNYAISNFKEGKQPTQPGAFLVKNSWGSGWGNKNGYFYMSYQCANHFQTLSLVSNADTRNFYDNLYEYDELGRGNSFGYDIGKETVGANVFTKKSKGAENLNAISTYIAAEDTFIKVYACDGDDFSNIQEIPIKNRGAQYSSGYLIHNAGNVTLEFEDNLLINDEKYIVAISVMNENYKYVMVTESQNKNVNYRNHEGESYYASSIDRLKTSPISIGEGNNNICIKAFTKNVQRSEKFWNFTDEKFNELGTITSPTEFDELTFNGNTTYPISRFSTIKYINGFEFNQAVKLTGGNNLGKDSKEGTIEVSVSGAAELYVAAKASTDSYASTAEINIYDSNGNEVIPVDGNNSYSEGANVKKFVYDKSKFTTLRIAPGSSDMNIYSIAVKPITQKDSSSINKYWNMNKNVGGNYPDIYFMDGVTYEDFHVSNEYKITYEGYVNLQGRGTNNYKSIKFYTPSNTDIYVSARASSDLYLEERGLYIANKYGYIIGQFDNDNEQTLGTEVRTYKFSYTDDHYNGEDLYVRSFDSGIDIYDIRVVSRTYGDEVEGEINFSNEKFNDIKSLTENYPYGDVFEISATADKPVKIETKERMYEGEPYSRRLCLIGRGSSEYRNLKMNVPGNVKITLIVGHAGNATETRELVLFDQYNHIVAKANPSNDIGKVVFNYTGGSNTLYVRAKDGGMYIYYVKVSSSEYDSSTTSYVESNTDAAYINDEIVSGSAIDIEEDFDEDLDEYTSDDTSSVPPLGSYDNSETAFFEDDSLILYSDDLYSDDTE